MILHTTHLQSLYRNVLDLEITEFVEAQGIREQIAALLLDLV